MIEDFQGEQDPAKREQRADDLKLSMDQLEIYYRYLGKQKHEWPKELQDHFATAGPNADLFKAETVAEWVRLNK